MKIRRYMGKDTQEAILKVKMDLGNEAIILNTRKVRQKGLLKVFKKPMIEVLAAVDEEYGRARENALHKKPYDISSAGVQQDNSGLVPRLMDTKLEDLENKVSGMEHMIKEIYERVKVNQTRNVLEQPASFDSSGDNTSILQIFHDNLLNNEVEADIAEWIINVVKEKVGTGSGINDTASVLYNVISSVLGKPDVIKLRQDGKPTVIMFIGPPGVGKTTTLAKLAANYAINHKKRVGLLTTDTYRIAAVEQLRTYAEILGIPITVVYSVADIKDALESYSDKDLILIDTAGSSHMNKLQFDELKALVSATQADEVYLVISATTSPRNCREIIKNYSFLENYKIIFSKMDEAPVPGIILNAKYMAGKCISYITTGQSVPDDIEVADTDKIVKSLMGSIVR
jgi:flagellar biosynthesis protein FlhF